MPTAFTLPSERKTTPYRNTGQHPQHNTPELAYGHQEKISMHRFAWSFSLSAAALAGWALIRFCHTQPPLLQIVGSVGCLLAIWLALTLAALALCAGCWVSKKTAMLANGIVASIAITLLGTLAPSSASANRLPLAGVALLLAALALNILALARAQQRSNRVPTHLCPTDSTAPALAVYLVAEPGGALPAAAAPGVVASVPQDLPADALNDTPPTPPPAVARHFVKDWRGTLGYNAIRVLHRVF
jgi:hypothetical protein